MSVHGGEGRLVVLVGPVPPPIDGRAVATEWLIDALRSRAVPLVVNDTQLPAGPWQTLRKLAVCCRAGASILVRSPGAVVVVASGGLGQVAELVPLLAARVRGRTAHLIHHSSAYIRSPSVLLRLLITIGGAELVHVVLSDAMGAELRDRYQVPERRVTTVENVGLMPPIEAPALPRARTLVHLSNLSVEKGSVVAIEVARRVSAPIALVGPTNLEVEAAMRASMASVRATGPLVGVEKARELSTARAFLFPSFYEHEAQPLVIYEAAQLGTVPIAWDCGWIAEQMADLGLSEFLVPAGDVDGLVATVSRVLDLSAAEYQVLSERVRTGFEDARSRALAHLEEFSAALQGGAGT